MNFAFSVVCKVPNSFAKSKNSPTPRDFAFRLGKPKVWTPSLNFFFTDRAGAFFFRSHSTNNGRHATGGTLLEEVRDTLAAEGSFARKLEGGRTRQLEGRRARAAAGGRAGAAGREDGRREIAWGGVGAGGTESDVEGQNYRCKVVGRFAYIQSLNLYLQS